MSKFGKYAIVDNIRYNLEKEPTLWWEFKPPTAREEISINRFTQGGSIKQSVQGIERKVVTTAEIALEELALTYAGSNLVGDDDKPLFDETMSVANIKEVIRTFPKALFYELWRALGDVCPGWGALPARTAKDEDKKGKAKPKAGKAKPKKVEVDDKEAEVGPKVEASSKS